MSGATDYLPTVVSAAVGIVSAWATIWYRGRQERKKIKAEGRSQIELLEKQYEFDADGLLNLDEFAAALAGKQAAATQSKPVRNASRRPLRPATRCARRLRLSAGIPRPTGPASPRVPVGTALNALNRATTAVVAHDADLADHARAVNDAAANGDRGELRSALDRFQQEAGADG